MHYTVPELRKDAAVYGRWWVAGGGGNGKGIRHTLIQLFPDVHAPLLNSNAVAALSFACAARGHKHVLSWLAYAELHVAETLQGP